MAEQDGRDGVDAGPAQDGHHTLVVVSHTTRATVRSPSTAPRRQVPRNGPATPSRLACSRKLGDEELHVDYLETQLELMRTLGKERYLAQCVSRPPSVNYAVP